MKQTFSNSGQHFLKLQAGIGLMAILLERVFWWEPFNSILETSGLGEFILSVVSLCFLLLFNLLSFGSALWNVFGDGRWMTRFNTTFVSFQCLLLIFLSLCLYRNGTKDFIGDGIALWASLTAGYLACICLLGGVFKLMKKLGYGMVFYSYASEHERESETELQAQKVVQLSGVSTIADLFLLTFWSAVLLTLTIQVYRYYYVDVDLDDQAFFGRDFGFVIMLFLVGAAAVVSMFTLVPSFLIAIIKPRFAGKQIVLQTLVLLNLFFWILVMNQWEWLDDDGILIVASFSGLFFCFQIGITLLLRRPTRWFRFRLVRKNAEGTG